MMEGGCKGFCVYPHGTPLSILAMIMAFISWGLSISVHGTCNFVRATDVLSTGFGMWTKENVRPTPSNTYSCQAYEFSEARQFDTKWNAAAGLAYSAGVIGFIFTVLLIGSSCGRFSQNFFKLTSFNFVMAGILDFCTLIAVNSDICSTLTVGNVIGDSNTCNFSTGAGLAIGAGVGYFLTAVIVWCIPSTDHDVEDDDDYEEEEKDASEPLKSGGEDGSKTYSPVPDDAKNVGAQAPRSDVSNSKDGVETTFDIEAKDVGDTEVSLNAKQDDDTGGEVSDEMAPRGFCLSFWSNTLFLLGAVFFMVLAVLDLQWVKDVLDFTNASTKDKLKWWWNSCTVCPGDCVIQTRFHCVSQYQIIYFIGACSFMLEGFVDFFGTPGTRGIFFIFAGTFGLVAAWLAERDPSLSNIFNLMSAHLYMLEAIGLVLNRDEFTGRFKRWVLINDICFVVATTMDVVLSYYGLKMYNYAIAKSETAAAALWLFCGCFYVGVTLYAKRIGYFEGQKKVTDDEEEQEEIPKEEKAVSNDELPGPGDDENVSA